jgi:ABC-type oligopeptide transport system substrate-binding subunit
MTMLGYGVFAPMSRSYYESQGGKFGAEFDSAAADYNYGKTPDNIAYCGPFLVTNLTEKSTIVYQANPSYWNPDAMNIHTQTWVFNDGSDATKAYNDMKAGVIDGTGLNASALELAKGDGWFDQYHYVSATDATSYMGFFNINRAAFANTNDETTVISPQSDDDKARTLEAMNNVHFRRAVAFAFDRAAGNAQSVGEELKLTSLRNSYTPGNFVTLSEDVSVDINGTATNFAAGTYYGEIMQAQIDADGVKIKVWDSTADGGAGSGDGFDGWYNPANAAEELETAIAELADKGIVIDEQNPIYVDLPFPSNNENYTNKANAYKQSVEAAFGGKVLVNLTECVDYDQWYYAGYYTDYGYEANYDIYDLSGWGPDYGDPQTYLDTFLPDFAGYMIKCIGIF